MMNRQRLYLHTISLILLGTALISACSAAPAIETAPASPSATETLLPSDSTASATATLTPTETATPTPTDTPTPTVTRTPRPTRSYTAGPSNTPSATPIGTLTPTPIQAVSGPFKSVLTLDESAPGLVQAIFPLDSSLVWITGTYGVMQVNLEDETSTLLRGVEDVLGFDRRGNVWKLDYGGDTISAWDGIAWQSYGRTEGWTLTARLETSPLPTPSIQYDAQGNLWMVTATDIRTFNGRTWLVIPDGVAGLNLPYKAGVSTSTVFALDLQRDLTWIGSCNWKDQAPIGGGGLQVQIEGQWQSAGFPLENTCISGLQVDAQGTLWVAAGIEVWTKPLDGTWQKINNPYPSAANSAYVYIEDLAQLPDGSIWPLLVSATANGNILTKTRFLVAEQHLELVRQVSGVDQQELVGRPDGSVWSFEQNAIYQFVAGESWTLVANIPYRDFAVDLQGTVWLVSAVKENPTIWKTLE